MFLLLLFSIMTFESAALILACIATSYFIWNYCNRIFFTKEKIILPGPWNFYGSKFITDFFRRTPNVLLDFINFLAKNYSSPFQIRMNNMPFVIVYEPNQVKTILKSQHCLEKGVMYKFAKPIFGMGLLTAPASIWTQSREIIVSSFDPIMLQKFFDTFVEQSLILTNKLEKVALNGNKIIFLEHITGCALDIVYGAKMSNKLESNKKDEYVKAIARFNSILEYRYSTWVLNNFSYYDVIFQFTTLGREHQKIIKLIESVTKEIVQEQHKFNKLHIIKTETNTNPKTLLCSLIETLREKNFSEKLIYDNVITLLLPAINKINTTLDFVVFMLANFPEIQEKVYKELAEIYGTETPTSAQVKYNDLQRMHYLDRVIKETMRLFPAIPLIARQLTKDIKIGESILPKNTNIVIPFIRMYRNEEYWPDPLKFDPDRFLPERIKDNHLYYYIPFSDGPRNCIGVRCAMISMKVILATLVRTFVFKVDKSVEIDKIKLKMNATLSTIEPLEVRIEKRDL